MNAITNGTEKQIAWATDIKAQMLHMMVRAADLIVEMAANAKSERTIRKYTAQSETLARGIVNVKACADATWFIDNRKRVTETDEDIIANAKANGMEVMEDGIRMHRNVITRCSLALAKIAPEAPEPETTNEPTDEQATYETFRDVVLAAYDFVEAVLEEDPNDYDARGIALRFGKQLDNGLWHFNPDEEDAEVLRIIDTEYFIA